MENGIGAQYGCAIEPGASTPRIGTATGAFAATPPAVSPPPGWVIMTPEVEIQSRNGGHLQVATDEITYNLFDSGDCAAPPTTDDTLLTSTTVHTLTQGNMTSGGPTSSAPDAANSLINEAVLNAVSPAVGIQRRTDGEAVLETVSDRQDRDAAAEGT